MPCSRYCGEGQIVLTTLYWSWNVLEFHGLTRGETLNHATHQTLTWSLCGTQWACLAVCLLGWWCIRGGKMWQGWQRCSRGWQRWPHVAAVRLSDPSQGWSSGCQRQRRSTSARLFSTDTEEDRATRDGSDTGNSCRHARYFNLLWFFSLPLFPAGSWEISIDSWFHAVWLSNAKSFKSWKIYCI